ncbi:Exoglucanase [Arthrobotrys entomopaga]|nr:Exoglucanase [Arthrobotrys entomopaga]
MKYSTLAAFGALLSLVAATPVEKRTSVPANTKTKYNLDMTHFHSSAKRGRRYESLGGKMSLLQRRWFGQATETYTLDGDAPYAVIAEAANAEFNRVTPENTMKWETIEPQQGVFDFTLGDALVAWADANDQAVRGHTLVWHSQLPDWVNYPAVPWTKETLKPVLENHVRTIVRHYKGKVDMWDVVNEMFNDDGSFRETVFYNTFGTDFVGWALTWAHEEDPDALLFINDYNFEYVSDKVNAAATFFKSLIDQGFPLGAVGAQSHLIVGQVDQAGITAGLSTFADLGLLVYLTEVDIRYDIGRGNDIANYTTSQIGQEAKDYYELTNACLAVDNCLGMTVWEYTDKYSWIPGVFDGAGAALPWDVRLNKKPAYTAIMEAIEGSPCTVCDTEGLDA